MKEHLQKWIKTKQAKIGFVAVCIAAILAAAFLLQPTPTPPPPGGSGGNPPEQLSSSSSVEANAVWEDVVSAAPAASCTTASNQTPSASSMIPEGTGSSSGVAPAASKPPVASNIVQPATSTPPPKGPNASADERKTFTCTLSIRCDTIQNNMALFNKDKRNVLPNNGVILETATVPFQEGESVFDVLKRVTRERRIHLEFKSTPVYQSAYIQGIHNLYEFDCGALSGWMYKVNGNFPNYGCSRCLLKPGDVIEWVYTCDLGRDVGGQNATGQGNGL